MARFLRICAGIILGVFAVHVMTLGANLTLPGLTIRLPDGQEAEPGELVSYGFVLINTGTDALNLQVSFKSTPAWPLLGETGPLHLAPGEETVVAVSVFVPAEAPAGTEHHLELVLTGGEGRVVAGVITRVKPRYGLAVNGPPPVTAPAGGEPVLPFLLVNRGNVEDTFFLRATSANGWEVDLASASVTIPPGETETVECKVKIPSWAPLGLTEEVILAATSAATGEQVEARARVKIGPSVGEGRIPVGEEEFRLVCDLGFSFLTPASPAEPSQIWFHALGTGKPGARLEFLLAGEENEEDYFSLTDYFFLYRERAYEIKLGDFPSTWPGLVLPGTGRMGLEASSSLGQGHLRLMLGREEETGDISWYATAWRTQWRGWYGEFRLLATAAGINQSPAPYLELSLDRYLAGASFSGDLAIEAKESPRSAGYFQYGAPANPFGWEVGFSWTDRINRTNFLQTFFLKGTYNPASGPKAGFSLSQTEATATATQAAYLARTADLRLRFGPRTTATFTAKGIWEEDFAWDLGQTYYLFKLSYQNDQPGSVLALEALLSSTEDIAGNTPPQYGFSFHGRYRLSPKNSLGTWEARVEADLNKTEPAPNWDLTTANLRLTYEDRLGWPRVDGSYRLGLTYTLAPLSLQGLTAAAALAFRLGTDTHLNAELTAAAAASTLKLETVHRFGAGLPRPHATIKGFAFQDLDDDGQPGPEEPGLAGLWLVLDGQRVGRTGSDGRWSLLGVKPGRHTVAVETSEDPTLRAKFGPVTCQIRAGETKEIFLPLFRLTTLMGRLFLDRDGDGLLGEGDDFLPGFSLLLTRPDGETETVTTAGDGSFLFPDLPPGDYQLTVEVPPLFTAEIEPPAPIAIPVRQQGQLFSDLALKPKEKPIIITYTEPPQVSVDLAPEAVEPGQAFTLTVTSTVPMTKIRLEMPDAPPEEIEVSGLRWQGCFVMPPERPPGTMAITVFVWWSGGEEPVRLKAELEVREPLRLTATAAPAHVGPGDKVRVGLTANRELATAQLLLPWGETILLDCRDKEAFGEVILPEDLLVGGDYTFTFSAWDKTGLARKTEAKIFLDPVLLLVTLRLYPFATGAAEIKEDFKPILARVAAILHANPDLRLLIIGHTDATGKKATNDALSLKRALAVKEVLVADYGIDPGRLEVMGKGSAAPLGDNNTPEGRALNRRVEFTAAE